MDNSEFTKIYSTLGVFQDDGWEMVRAAYKKQIKRWHPDRFQEPAHRKIAEEKSKEINHAYQKLSEYYEKFGVLPPDHYSDAVPSRAAPTSGDTLRTDLPEDRHVPLHEAATGQPGTQRSYIPIVILGIVFAVGYSLWEPAFLTQSGIHETNWAEHSGSTADNSWAAKNPDDDENTGGSEASIMLTANDPDHSTNAAGWTGETNNTAPGTRAANMPGHYKTNFETEAAPTSTLAQPGLIKKGSTKNEVLAAQGPPQRQTDTAWDYGASRIYFQGGYVSGWHENPLNPLSIVR